MTPMLKFLCGAVVASLLAWGASSESYVDGLEAKGKAALAEGGFDGATLSMARDPLARIAVLDGVTDPAKRAAIEASLANVPGIAGVRWVGDAADGDGVGNGKDDGETVAAAEATSGASEEKVADCQTQVNTFMEGKTINFATGSANLAPASAEIVDGLAKLLGECTGMAVAVGGHTDATGSDETNRVISQARADAVAAALTAKGVAEARITATGFGSSKPLVAGDGANAANRRIEFTLDAGGAEPAAEGTSEGEE